MKQSNPPNTMANPPPGSETGENNSPPKTKSHYFVQKYDFGDGNKKCPICGKFFHTNRKNKRYCSRECYLIGVKTTKAIWYKQNKEHCLDNMKNYQDKVRPVKFGEITKERMQDIKFYKCCLIKRKLLNMNLLTFCLLNEDRIEELKKTPILTHRYKVHQDKVDQIVCELTKLGLYDREAREIDYTPPKLDIEEPKIAINVRYTPLILLPQEESINPYSHTI